METPTIIAYGVNVSQLTFCAAQNFAISKQVEGRTRHRRDLPPVRHQRPDVRSYAISTLATMGGMQTSSWSPHNMLHALVSDSINRWMKRLKKSIGPSSRVAFILLLLLPSAPAAVTVEVKAIDELGKPLEGIRIDASTWKGITSDAHGWPDDDYEMKSGTTDKAGATTIMLSKLQKKTIGISVASQPAEFYKNNGQTVIVEKNSHGWPAIVPVILTFRRRHHPMPMYVTYGTIQLPKAEGPWRYDLITRDWLPPNGSGAQADFEFSLHYDKEPTTSAFNANRSVFDLTMKITAVSNNSGFIPYCASDSDKQSDFQFPYVAPTNRYSHSILFRNWTIDGRIYDIISSGHSVYNFSPSFAQSFIFRINAHDNPTQPMFGMIANGLSHWDYKRLKFNLTYYINPDSSSLEWNGKNLFIGEKNIFVLPPP